MWEGGGSARGSEGRGAGDGSAVLEGGELDPWRRQRDSGGLGGGGNAAPEGGEKAAARQWRAGSRL